MSHPGITFDTFVESSAEAFEADPFRIEQAVENVVTNALRHTPSGGRIAMTARTIDARMILEMCDSGEGLPAEHLPHIFDRFYKASSVKGIASPGSGLGLSIVKAIVTSHGGRVSATSAGGIGTIVRIELPQASQIPELQIQT
jgi:signal transduction histidine kinase